MRRSLVSLCITCYNQARFIREAVQSAFDQTYDPLEIVICDDCSNDGTDKIVAAMVDDYRARVGRHKVIFKRNEMNFYVMKNYEQAFRMAHGELLITGAGDDISMPNRAERIVEAWEKSGRKATCIFHGWEKIDLKGHVVLREGPWRIETPLGAATAYARCAIDGFSDPVTDRSLYEDHIFSARALMFGVELEIDEPLICYRSGSGETTRVSFLEHRKRVALHGVRSNDVILRELREREDILSRERIDAVRQLQSWRMGRFKPEYDLIVGTSVVKRWRAFRQMLDCYGWSRDVRWLDYFPLVFPSRLQPGVAVLVRRYYRKISRMVDYGFKGTVAWMWKKLFRSTKKGGMR